MTIRDDITAAQIDAAHAAGGYVRRNSTTRMFDIYYGGKRLGDVETYRHAIDELVCWHEMVEAEQDAADRAAAAYKVKAAVGDHGEGVKGARL